MSNKTSIHIMIFGDDKIDKSSFLKNLKESKIMSRKNENEITFFGNVKLENEKKLDCFLYVTNNNIQLKQFAAKLTGLILIFDPEKQKSLDFVETVFNNTKKSKNLNNLYIIILGNKLGKTEINGKAKDFAEKNGIKYCDSNPENIEDIIKEIYNSNQNKKQEINQKKDDSKGNDKKRKRCCGCLK